MKHLLFTVFVFLCLFPGTELMAQYCTAGDRYSEAAVFKSDEIQVDLSLRYGVATNRDDQEEELLLDVYYPDTTLDTAQLRPLVILTHGGGFRGGDRAFLAGECLAFAERGYVCASISYRLGFNASNPVDYLRAIYRAQQDADAASRYLASQKESYRIDPAWTFLGGRSAGAVTSLNRVYLTEADWVATIPNIANRLGPLSRSGNEFTDSVRVRAIFNNWGSVPGIGFQEQKMLPMIAFHGEEDDVVPIDRAPEGSLGSRAIHEGLQAAGICSDLTVQPDGKHGVYADAAGTLARIGKAACFFKRIMCNSCTSANTTGLVPASCNDLVNTNDPAVAPPVTVYPNPFSGRLQVLGATPLASFRLLDLTGRIHFSGSDLSGQNFKHLPAGVYVLEVSQARRRQLVRLVKQ